MHHCTYLYSRPTSSLRLLSTSGSALNTSQKFGCEDYLSPNTSSGESLIHCAIFYIFVSAPNICLAATIYKRIRAQDISGVSAVNNISHPIIYSGSHSFSLPLYIRVFAPIIYLGATIYTGTALNTSQMFWL